MEEEKSLVFENQGSGTAYLEKHERKEGWCSVLQRKSADPAGEKRWRKRRVETCRGRYHDGWVGKLSKKCKYEPCKSGYKTKSIEHASECDRPRETQEGPSERVSEV